MTKNQVKKGKIGYCLDCGTRLTQIEREYAARIKLEWSRHISPYHRNCCRLEIKCNKCSQTSWKPSREMLDQLKLDLKGLKPQELNKIENNEALQRLLGLDHLPWGYWRFRLDLLDLLGSTKDLDSL